MKAKALTAITLIAVLALLLSGPATAQGPEPPGPRPPGPKEPWPGFPGLPRGGPYQTPDGYWAMPEGAHPPLEAAGISPQA
ncbi:MAG: hypothetical protein ACP5N6_15380, partial [Anaerolineae bacterium]